MIAANRFYLRLAAYKSAYGQQWAADFAYSPTRGSHITIKIAAGTPWAAMGSEHRAGRGSNMLKVFFVFAVFIVCS